MKTELYRYDGTHEKRFPLELIAIDYANSFHDDGPATVEKWMDGKWWDLHEGDEHRDAFWADGIYSFCLESNTELEFKINDLWIERKNQLRRRDHERDDTEETRKDRTLAQAAITEIEAQILDLQNQREAMLATIDSSVGFELSHENYEDTINILGAINHALQGIPPLMITGKKLHFRTGPFCKVHNTTLYFACTEFHRFAKAKGLIDE